jgi:pilus assembly protein CpaE
MNNSMAEASAISKEAIETNSAMVGALLISSDENIRNDVVSAFERLDRIAFAWVTAETMSRGFDQAINNRPSLLLLDLQEDFSESFRFAARLREQAPEVRIVGLYNPMRLPKDKEASELVLEGVRAGFFDFLRIPVSSDEVRRMSARLVSTRMLSPSKTGHSAPTTGRVISFISGKGGVGKTTLAANTATALARVAPKQVAIIDTSMDLGNICDYLNVNPNSSLYDTVIAGGRLDRDLLISLMTYSEKCGVYVLGGPRKLEQMMAISDEEITQVILAARSAFKYVIIDTLPLFNSIGIAVGDLSDQIVVVAEPLVPAINGTRELLSKLRDVGYPATRVKLLLNKYTGKFGENVEPAMIVDALQRPIDWLLPYDGKMNVCANEGNPYLQGHSQTTLAEKLELIANDLAGLPRQLPGSFISRLFGIFR